MDKTFIKEGRSVYLSYTDDRNAPLIVFAGGDRPEEDIASVQEMKRLLKPYIKKAVIPDFHILTISSPNWDEDYSPWEAIVSDTVFPGGIRKYLSSVKMILDSDELKEYVEYSYSNTYYIGYSLAGLASIYGITEADIRLYRNCACVSGSLWFPGWMEHIKAHAGLVDKEAVIYISLGSKEVKTRNPLMKENGTFCEQTNELLRSNNINSVFTWNNGNHFYEVDRRMARSILSLLSGNTQKPEF